MIGSFNEDWLTSDFGQDVRSSLLDLRGINPADLESAEEADDWLLATLNAIRLAGFDRGLDSRDLPWLRWQQEAA